MKKYTKCFGMTNILLPFLDFCQVFNSEYVLLSYFYNQEKSLK